MRFALALVLIAPVFAGDVQLPAPKTDGGMPLMRALKERRTIREFTAQKLPPEVLSNLLWAAFGVNRADGRRTAPSAHNWQEIDVYVTTGSGAYVYDARGNRLREVAAGDARALPGSEPVVPDAPVNLIYVADLGRVTSGTPEERQSWTALDAGFIAQNVYLFCASEGLATVFRGGLDRAAVGKALRLRPDQHIVGAQTVGYPK